MPRWISEIALPLVSGAALFFGLVVLNWSEVLFEFPSVTRAAEAPAAALKDIADAVDQVVSMLMTIGIGLFVFFGFAIKYFFDKERYRRATILLQIYKHLCFCFI
ncbi:hypothetical protein U8C32_11935 [Sinorhizobium medicae]|uniref:hypothetical protein n=1 Tax=Sinorhizobium medicae TaxID=110321 RepID=UPI002AF6B984|nr:hypothetical protein [Sinorhizobium medicae]WQO43996.1 hypothetical protein U8C42_12095 [Sinorhizobium medicae]WQO67028.1 hypothetical protein U8C40_07820 [Sinorhizobium medicae]WQO71147.1 hypothetical protein U8C31_12580 [Sinorhizobium medicae]WQO90563.1 hypothetical protein U8C32_11935 [Sinorhizobium medicae]